MANSYEKFYPKTIYRTLSDIFTDEKKPESLLDKKEDVFFVDNYAESKLLSRLQKQNDKEKKLQLLSKVKMEEEAKRKFVNKDLIESCINAIKDNSEVIENYKDCISKIKKEFNIKDDFKPEKVKYNRKKDEQEKEINDADFIKIVNERIAYYKCKYGGETPSTMNFFNFMRTTTEKKGGEIQDNFKSQAKMIEEEQNKKNNPKKPKKEIRLNILKKNLYQLVHNGVTLKEFLDKNPFQDKPFQLKNSAQFIDAVKFDKFDVIESPMYNKDYLFSFDFFGQTAFHWAAKRGKIKSLKLLLQMGKCVNQYDKNKMTPLAIAAKNNDYELCSLLLENGAFPLLQNSEGLYPRELADDAKVKELILTYEEKYRILKFKEFLKNSLK